MFLLACFSARRRRRRGFAPYHGTGWLGGRTPAGHAPAQYAPDYGQNFNGQQQQPYYPQGGQAPPPQYNQYGNGPPAQGYYGDARQGDVELQSPPNSYYPQGGDPVYAPPMSPPPGHGQKDGIIR
ncbi:MAG: hypothetical protein M4579_004887 [Chaenotheca gracillima]|nr:MAG: hypothetical protein M4579_004887 [Chaenotheca gracillima]